MKSSFSTLLLVVLYWSLSVTACAQKNEIIDTQNLIITENGIQKPGNPIYSNTDTNKVKLSDAEWKEILPEEVYYIARKAGTERAFTGKFWNYSGKGTYYCAACGNLLFRSDAKFASMCGWPSFYEQERSDAITFHEDNSYGMNRIETRCGRCDGHLGHIFDDGPEPTGKRYCINSLVLDFVPDDPTQIEQ